PAREDPYGRAHLLGQEQKVLHVGGYMLGHTINDDKIAAAGECMGNGPFGFEAIAALLQICDFEARTKPDASLIRRKLANQHIDKRGLACAVRPRDTHAIAAVDAHVERFNGRLSAKRLRDRFRLDYELTG